MKMFDWFVAISLIVTGITCLTMSASWMMGSMSMLNNFFNVCMWTSVPLIFTGLIYLIYKSRKGDRK